MNPLNLLVLEKKHLNEINSSYERSNSVKMKAYHSFPEQIKGFPLNFIHVMNAIIITDIESDTFYYIKNRYVGDTITNYPLSELPKHIRRANRLSNNCLTWRDTLLNAAYTILNKIGQ